jgi:hypothetical protein
MENTNNDIYQDIDLDEDEKIFLQQKKQQEAKAKSIFKKIITHAFLISFTIFIAFSAFSIVSYCWKDNNLQKNMMANYSLKQDNFFYKETVNEQTITQLNSFVKSLPEGISHIFYNDWIVVVDDEFPEQLSTTISGIVENNDYDTSGLVLGGYTFTQSRIIYINGTLSDETIYDSFVHEIGHLTSFEYGSQHGSKEWDEIYNKGITTLDVSDYDKSNQAEFFASCFQLYFTEREKLTVYLNDANIYFANLLSQEVRQDNFISKYMMGYENTINTLRLYLNNSFSS